MIRLSCKFNDLHNLRNCRMFFVTNPSIVISRVITLKFSHGTSNCANLNICLAYVSLQFCSLFRMERLILPHRNLVCSELLYQVLTFQTNSMYIVSHSLHNQRKSLYLPTPLSASDATGYSLSNHASTYIFCFNETSQYENT